MTYLKKWLSSSIFRLWDATKWILWCILAWERYKIDIDITIIQPLATPTLIDTNSPWHPTVHIKNSSQGAGWKLWDYIGIQESGMHHWQSSGDELFNWEFLPALSVWQCLPKIKSWFSKVHGWSCCVIQKHNGKYLKEIKKWMLEWGCKLLLVREYMMQ